MGVTARVGTWVVLAALGFLGSSYTRTWDLLEWAPPHTHSLPWLSSSRVPG